MQTATTGASPNIAYSSLHAYGHGIAITILYIRQLNTYTISLGISFSELENSHTHVDVAMRSLNMLTHGAVNDCHCSYIWLQLEINKSVTPVESVLPCNNMLHDCVMQHACMPCTVLESRYSASSDLYMYQ
jgi:hypothetical protein